MLSPDSQRLIEEYARRAREQRLSGLYLCTDPGNLHISQSLERVLLKAFASREITKFAELRLLDVGCGNGGNLHRFIGYGFKAKNCAGIDLLPERVERARESLPNVSLRQGDACRLEFEDAEFDVVTQFTVLSSILDENVRQAVANEMFRVVRPNGLILSYDFWINPVNRQTRGVKPCMLRHWFPQARCEFHRITLAPPIVRRLARVSWTAATALEALRIFNTHYLAIIEKI